MKFFIAVFFTLLFVNGSLFFLFEFFLFKNQQIPFDLLSVHFVNFILVFFVCGAMYFLKKYMPNQAGFLYLSSMFIKIGVLFFIFSDFLLSQNEISKWVKISFFAPYFLSLLVEVFFIVKLLMKEEK